MLLCTIQAQQISAQMTGMSLQQQPKESCGVVVSNPSGVYSVYIVSLFPLPRVVLLRET